MAFLENLKKNLSTAADYTAKKTAEVTEAAKITVEIKSKTSKLNAVFTELGHTAYSDFKSGTSRTAEIEALAAQADALKEEIAVLKVQLARAQGCVICPACGTKSKDAANFCANCGEKLPKEEPAKEEDLPAEDTETPAEEPAAEEAAEEETAEEEAAGETEAEEIPPQE